MHRSRLSTLVVDVPAHLAGRATDFWAAALGAEIEELPDEPGFTGLCDAVPQLVTAVQAVDDAPRLHEDLETDDVPAEVARLRALGAEPVSTWQGCHVLRAPGGHLLCVVPVHSDEASFTATARTWP